MGIALHLPVNKRGLGIQRPLLNTWGCGKLDLYSVQPAILLIIICYILGGPLSKDVPPLPALIDIHNEAY